MGRYDQDWETACPNRDDEKHCVCWYDGEPCCGCTRALIRRIVVCVFLAVQGLAALTWWVS